MSHPSLTPKQEKALAALLTEPTIQAAAALVGVNPRTLHTWLADPAFEREYRKARREAVRQAVAQLQRSATGAAAALSEIAEDPGEKAPARVAAARAILELAIRAVELEDLEARIAALEESHAQTTA